VINVDEFSYLLRTAIIAESVTVVWKNCVDWNGDFGLHHDHCMNVKHKLFIDSYYSSVP